MAWRIGMMTALIVAGLVGPVRAEISGPALVGQPQLYRAAFEDTLIDLAVRNRIGYVQLIAANPDIDPWLPGAGTMLTLPTSHLLPRAEPNGIVINLPEMRLYYFSPEGELLHTGAIGIGREGMETPVGSTKVTRKKAKPTWYPPDSIKAIKPYLPDVVPPGPDNPLGLYALYLGWDHYLIHGTNTPVGVGRRTSGGCIRMYPADIEVLFNTVPIGTPVTVVDQPIKVGWIDNELYLEVHPTVAMIDAVEANGRVEAQPADPDLKMQVWFEAGLDEDQIDWAAAELAGRERRGVPVRISR